ncbi:hypothetical protein M0805_004620 [Coniferiporia weirii]|nr:hypothetical protein M0805_004620 [Coniferiporia weirii]
MNWSLLLQQPVCLSLFLLLLFRTSLADPVNVTIDDQDGDPTNGQHISYSPPGAWQAGQTCTDCTAKPSPASDAYLGTWTDSTFYPAGDTTVSTSGQIIQASASFVGTAVYVVCILTGTSTSPDGNTDLTFKIDNATTSTFQRAPNGNATYLFNQTVFAQTGLPNTLHTITIESGHAGQKALILLDAIIYTADDNSTSSSAASSPGATGSSSSDTSQSGSSTNVGVIIGPVVAAVIVVPAASIALFLFVRKRGRSQGKYDHVSIDSPAIGGASQPRSHDPEVHDMRYLVNTEPFSEHTVSPSVTSGYPVTASGSDRSTDVRTSGLGASSEPLSPGGRTDPTRNMAPSDVDSTVYSNEVPPPAYDVIASSSAVSQSFNPQNRSTSVRPLPPRPDLKS